MIRMHMSSQKDYLKDSCKHADPQFYDILLYKSIQPYPLRDDMERVRNYGKDNNEIPDAKGNLL